jgi:hypothetical protein
MARIDDVMNLSPVPLGSRIKIQGIGGSVVLEWERYPPLMRVLAKIFIPSLMILAFLLMAEASQLCLGNLFSRADPWSVGSLTAYVMIGSLCALFLYLEHRCWKCLRLFLKDPGRCKLEITRDALQWYLLERGDPTQILAQSVRQVEMSGGSWMNYVTLRRKGVFVPDVVLPGRFAPGDPEWLADVLRRWHASA